MPTYRVRIRRVDGAGVAHWTRTVRAARLTDAVDIACSGAGLRRSTGSPETPRLIGTWAARRTGPAGRRERRAGGLTRREPPASVPAALPRPVPGPDPIHRARDAR